MNKLNQLNTADTIAGVSTPAGGGIGIVRMSGGKSLSILRQIFCGCKSGKIESHRIYYGHIKDGGKIIDEVLVSIMLAPKTYTREDMVEINCHGGIKPIQAILALLLQKGARLAEPGEFTKRAFLSGRIDLSQAEAVMDIINAKTALSHQSALCQLEGRLSAQIKPCADKLLICLAQIETSIDYPEHEEAEVVISAVKNDVQEIIKLVQSLLDTAENGRVIREGIETVILGKPNVGKSSLLNALLNEERAIVTDIPGTTRDVLKEYVSISGIPLRLADTAGIRQTDDVIERMGVERSLRHAEQADLILLVLDGSEEIAAQDSEILAANQDKKIIVLINKSDLEHKIDSQLISQFVPKEYMIEISAKNYTGLEDLAEKIKTMFFGGEIDWENAGLVSNSRHINALNNAIHSLRNALGTIEAGLAEDFIAIDLQDAYSALGAITGGTVEEDLINKIFSEFCLGK